MGVEKLIKLTAHDKKRKVTFFEDVTGTITNGTIWIKFNYSSTEPPNVEFDYSREDLEFKNNGTVIPQ